MQAQVIVSNQLEMKKVNNIVECTIEKILNALHIQTTPCVIEFFVYFKVNFIPVDIGIELSIRVEDQDQNVIAATDNMTMYNKRSLNEIPTIEGAYKIKATTTKKGLIFIDLLVDSKIIYKYPILLL